jgi:hypothetical protein
LKIGSGCCGYATLAPVFWIKNAKKAAKTPKTPKEPKTKVTKGIPDKNTPLPNLLRGSLQAEIGRI